MAYYIRSFTVDYIDISWRSAARERQTREGWVKSAVFCLSAWISQKW